MHFRIEAQLLQGEPRLRIFDAESGALRLQWRYRAALAHGCQEDHLCGNDQHCLARANLHTLMRDLFLLSCVGKAGWPNLEAATDVCAYCDRCTVSHSDTPWHAALSHSEQR